jgi:hypothetical protein
LHDTGRPHDVEVEPCWQAPVPMTPLHFPVLPQGGAAVHWPVGAVVPAGSAVQVPDGAQVSQVPHVAVPQQTPLTQLPLMHWLPAVQVVPLGLSAQFLLGAVPWQVKGDRQSVSAAQGAVLQALPPHV